MYGAIFFESAQKNNKKFWSGWCVCVWGDVGGGGGFRVDVNTMLG